MPKLRKMLGDVQTPECAAMMRLIETQSRATLETWAVRYAKERYLPIYESARQDEKRLRGAVEACGEYLAGNRSRADVKPFLKEAGQLARGAADNPVAQAAARAVSTACSVLQTPTGALGFLFYGAAAAAYSGAGLAQPAEVYDALAREEFRRAMESLAQAADPNEKNPVKIDWNC